MWNLWQIQQPKQPPKVVYADKIRDAIDESDALEMFHEWGIGFTVRNAPKGQEMGAWKIYIPGGQRW
jgi:hypothetical protein